MNHERLLELCLIYAVGALNGEELCQLVAHRKSGCPFCEMHIREYTRLLALLPQSLPYRKPSSNLKRQVLDQVESEGLIGPLAEIKPVLD